MAAEVKKEIQLEIAHILFIDIVGYSKLSINDQRAAIAELTQVVRTSEQFQNAEAGARLIKIPTGDGMALVFYKSPEEPVECALEISRALKEHPKIQLRMGAHSGPVSGVIDARRQRDDETTGPPGRAPADMLERGAATHGRSPCSRLSTTRNSSRLRLAR